MVYRPEFAKILGKIGSDLIYRYGKLAQRYFGSRAALDLGEIGSIEFPEPTQGFQSPVELWQDESAALSAGISELHIYSLDGLSKGEGIAPWLLTPPSHRPRRESGVGFYLGLIDFLSAFLPKAI
jgi:hypothetical protein